MYINNKTINNIYKKLCSVDNNKFEIIVKRIKNNTNILNNEKIIPFLKKDYNIDISEEIQTLLNEFNSDEISMLLTILISDCCIKKNCSQNSCFFINYISSNSQQNTYCLNSEYEHYFNALKVMIDYYKKFGFVLSFDDLFIKEELISYIINFLIEKNKELQEFEKDEEVLSTFKSNLTNAIDGVLSLFNNLVKSDSLKSNVPIDISLIENKLENIEESINTIKKNIDIKIEEIINKNFTDLFSSKESSSDSNIEQESIKIILNKSLKEVSEHIIAQLTENIKNNITTVIDEIKNIPKFLEDTKQSFNAMEENFAKSLTHLDESLMNIEDVKTGNSEIKTGINQILQELNTFIDQYKKDLEEAKAFAKKENEQTN